MKITVSAHIGGKCQPLYFKVAMVELAGYRAAAWA